MIKRFLFILLIPVNAFCQDYPAKPSNYVTDNAGILGPDEEHRLNSVLKTFEDSSSIQLFIYTSSSLNGAVMADLSQNIFHEWKIGNKKTNNGVLIAVFVNDHKFRIHTGYGMEGILPDLRTKRIQDEIMRPYFKENNYFMGLVEGVNKIIYYSKHEYKPNGSEKEGFALNWRNVFFGYLFNIPLLCIFIYLLLSKKHKEKFTRTGRTLFIVFGCVFALAPCVGSLILGFLFLLFRTGRGNSSESDSSSSRYFSWGSGSSYDDSSSSSSSSSDFGGGGGGDSGGGGSDSSW